MAPRAPEPEPWIRPVANEQARRPAPVDDGEVARRIWRGYWLKKPNDSDTIDAFHEAADWQRGRPAYVWRAHGSAGPGAREVYVLPARFVIAHPPFLPDYPTGYYRLDPACEPGDALSCVPPSAFFRILPAETVDEYAPPMAARVTAAGGFAAMG